MKAVLCPKYGPPEVLQIQDIPKPTPKDHELLINIHSTAVNSGDVRVRGLVVDGFLRIVMRIVLGFTGPRNPILGVVYAGTVERVGKHVTQFKPGDKVFGMTGFKFGTYAEYMTIAQSGNVVAMPGNATFDEAVALIFGGQTSIYFLEKLKVAQKPNAHILIIGATGSVGVAALQLAQYYGCKVTAVCSTAGKALVESLGVTNTLLYDQTDYLQTPERYDFIFDAVGKTTRKQCAKLLKPGGAYATVGGLDTASESRPQLELLKDLYEKGLMKAVIDRVYPLDKIVEAHRYVDTERKKGNVVIQVA
jgi:NADPH:quinone reductase-like Zn-dependent oxidoreductase